MIIIPFERIAYQTEFSVEKIFQKLEEMVEAEKFLSSSPLVRYTHEIPYEGEVAGDSFRIKRIRHQNVFFPCIDGLSVPDRHGMLITIKMRLQKAAQVFTGFYLLLVIACVLLAVVVSSSEATSRDTDTSPFFVFIPFMVLCLAYGTQLQEFTQKSKMSTNSICRNCLRQN